MAQALANLVLEECKKHPPVDDVLSDLDSAPATPNQKNEPENQSVERPVEPEAPKEPDASAILSAPKPLSPKKLPPVTKALKTRADLIQQIERVCAERGMSAKPLNLKRRRKASLQGILQEQLAEAVRKEAEPEVHEQVREGMPGADESRSICAFDSI